MALLWSIWLCLRFRGDAITSLHQLTALSASSAALGAKHTWGYPAPFFALFPVVHVPRQGSLAIYLSDSGRLGLSARSPKTRATRPQRLAWATLPSTAACPPAIFQPLCLWNGSEGGSDFFLFLFSIFFFSPCILFSLFFMSLVCNVHSAQMSGTAPFRSVCRLSCLGLQKA